MNEQLILGTGLMALILLYVGTVTEEFLSLVRGKGVGSHETRGLQKEWFHNREEGGAHEFHKV